MCVVVYRVKPENSKCKLQAGVQAGKEAHNLILKNEKIMEKKRNMANKFFFPLLLHFTLYST